MFKRLLPAALIGYLFLVIVNWGCTKLDTTSLGSDLIPVVDNVNTFADTLDIVTTQGIFDDTFSVSRSQVHVLGRINGDELFGNTQADINLQFKPVTSYPFYFGNAGDTAVSVDSVVLCLAYTGFWGDSTEPIHLNVKRINQVGFADSATTTHSIKYQPNTFSGILGSADIDVRRLKDTIRPRRDSVNNQIRIKLSTVFAAELFGRDTIPTSPNKDFRADSLFRRFLHGFKVEAPTTGNGLMYISLTDAKTRLEIHFKRKLANTGVLDTTVNYFKVTTSDPVSATANHIVRNFSADVQSPNPGSLYLATGPGTYANLSIPQLDTIGNAAGTHNRIVHRAEIYMEQEPDPLHGTDDSVFSAPTYMYLDLKDTGATKWKPLYFDLSPSEPYDPDLKTYAFYFPGSAGVDFSYFGGYARTRFNYLGEKVVYYTLNTTRHVQQILTRGTPNYSMRLFPAYTLFYPQYPVPSAIPYNNPLAYGRVRLKSGAYPDRQRKMRMVIIWSKI